MTRWHCCMMQKASGHPQHRAQFLLLHRKCEMVVLLPNSELTKGNNKRDADARKVRL